MTDLLLFDLLCSVARKCSTFNFGLFIPYLVKLSRFQSL